MLLRHAIGSVLRHLRLERGATLRQLSEESRISVPYLSEIERGRKEASSEILATLCRVLDITERELLARVAAEYLARPGAPSTAPVGARGVIDLTTRAESPSRIVEIGSRQPVQRSGSNGELLAA